MPDTTSLSARIAAINAATREWVAAGPNRCAGELVSDLAHWADYKVFTGEDLDIYLAATDVWEFTRSLFGYKPNWGALRAMSLPELEAEKARLLAYADSLPDEDEDIYADPNPEFWKDELAQEAWCNPSGELEFVAGCWHDPKK